MEATTGKTHEGKISIILILLFPQINMWQLLLPSLIEERYLSISLFGCNIMNFQFSTAFLY